MICPSENLEDAKEIVELAKREEGIWGLAGIYPGEVGSREIVYGGIGKLRDFVKQNREYIVGIGEIGLDRPSLLRASERQADLELFKGQLELAAEMDLPAVIHNRGAEIEIKEVMEGMDKLPGGQFHCWSGSDAFLDYVLSRGFYVGFCANVTYPKNDKLREQAARVPADRLLLETDSPYLPPQGKRGERNTPENVKMTAALLADLRGDSPQALAEQTTENAQRLFGI